MAASMYLDRPQRDEGTAAAVKQVTIGGDPSRVISMSSDGTCTVLEVRAAFERVTRGIWFAAAGVLCVVTDFEVVTCWYGA
jgi:hypothetical protein